MQLIAGILPQDSQVVNQIVRQRTRPFQPCLGEQTENPMPDPIQVIHGSDEGQFDLAGRKVGELDSFRCITASDLRY